MIRRLALVVAVVAVAGAASWIIRARSDRPPENAALRSAAPVSFKSFTPFEDARPVIDARRAHLPAGLAGLSSLDLEAAWPGWVTRHDSETRARLEHGDEDSLVNFWFYGTSFTTEPRVTPRDMAARAGGASAEAIIQHRLDDLVAGAAAPGQNERLQFARQLLARHGIDPASAAGREQAEQLLSEAATRMVSETAGYHRSERAAAALDLQGQLAAYATMFRDRGLSSDTSIAIEFAVESALEDIARTGRLGPGSVRRVAIVGPGLDFTDKSEGFDFYPPQSIQPFALVDSLIRTGLSETKGPQVTTFDLSPRVNEHLNAARARAQAGTPYVVQLPLRGDDAAHQWLPDLITYWQRFGSKIGDEVEAIRPPSGAEGVRVRAVRVRSDVVLAVTPRDVNIVLERLEPLADADRFDLVLATNVLVYYDTFEQTLALANIARMLRPGGFFLTNYLVQPLAPMEPTASLVTKVDDATPTGGNTLFWYQRR